MKNEDPDGGRPRLRGVVFDLDDTLVLSTVDYARFKELIIERISADGDDSSLYSTSENILSLLNRYRQRMRQKGVPESRILDAMAEFDRIMDQVELERVGETRGIDGARELLAHLKARGVMIGILTRGCEPYASRALEFAGLRELVDAVEARSPDTPPKPSPEAYLRLLERMGLDVSETVLVGDHVIDAECARNAGATFVGVMTGDLSEEALREAGSAEVFRSVGDMMPWFDRLLDDGD